VNRVERLTGIVLLLGERPRTAQQIAEHFAVSRRTVLRDVQALCEIGVPVVSREGVGGGFSLPAGYALAPPPLTSPEAFLLLLALQGLGDLAALPNAQARASLVAKLRAALPPAQLEAAAPLLEATRIEAPRQPQPVPFLDALVAAAADGRWVRVEYQSAQRLSAQHLLPRAVFAQNGLWYCRAFAAERAEERIYRADRVRALAPPHADFRPPPTPPALPYDHESHPLVAVSLSPRGAALLESEPHLGPQLACGPRGEGRIEFRCPPAELDYYARLFAGLGAHALVHEPPELRAKLRAIGENLVDRYGEW
jgi:predicted DNA-binding transcriptional regulator YafY